MTATPFLRPAFLTALLAQAVLVACGGGDDDGNTRVTARTVYTMDNGATGNHVLAFRSSAADGTLSALGSYGTGGNGTGTTEVSAATPQDGVDVLASQGSLAMSDDASLLVAVNAGSGTLTSFTIAGDGTLTRADTLPSGGLQPNAVAVRKGIVYVSNVGAASNGYASNITGFKIGSDGRLSPIAGATYALSAVNAQPSGILFNPATSLLAVSELTTGQISVFTVNADGTLGTPTVNASAGGAPFGAAFTNAGQLLVTEVANGSVSSYSVNAAGALAPISTSVVNGQAAVCWAFLSPDQATLYTSNSGSGTLSAYAVAATGAVTLRSAAASTLEGPGSGNIDGGVSSDGKYVYVTDGAIGAISALRVEADGTLTHLAPATGSGLPLLGGEGLVVR